MWKILVLDILSIGSADINRLDVEVEEALRPCFRKKVKKHGFVVCDWVLIYSLLLGADR